MLFSSVDFFIVLCQECHQSVIQLESAEVRIDRMYIQKKVPNHVTQMLDQKAERI